MKEYPDGVSIRTAALVLLDRRAADATICPSEIARALAGDAGDWRESMPAVHGEVARMVEEGLVRLSWKRVPRRPGEGPYRIGSAIR